MARPADDDADRPEPAPRDTTAATTDGVTSGPSGSVTRVTRGRVVLLCLLGAAITLASTMSTWVSARVGDAAGSSATTSTGMQAAPGLVPVALAAGAGAFALTLVDGWARRVVTAVVLVCGLVLIALTGALLLDPSAAVGGAGDAFSAPTPSAAESVVVSTHVAGPIAAVVGALVVVSGAALGLAAGGRWPTRAARQVSGPRVQRRRSDWERLSDGEDPT